MRPPPDPTATSPSRGEAAALLESLEVLPGRRRLTWAAPDIARRVQAGQYVHLLRPRRAGTLLPVLPVAGYDRVAGTITLLLSDADAPAADELRRLREGDEAVFEGPLGQGFRLDARSRFLLLVADGGGYARVRACVDEAVTAGRRVTLLYGAARVADILPSSLLPEEAEYVVATEDGSLGHHGLVTDIVSGYEAWADQCFAAGSAALLGRMAALARGRDARMGVARLGRRRGRPPKAGSTDARRRAWLQVALAHEAGCTLGVCLGCVALGVDGPRRICREGPAFAAGELRWEEDA